MNIYKNFGVKELVTDGVENYLTVSHILYIVIINGAERVIYKYTILCESTSTGERRELPECNLRHVKL
jgi:hypothetical protein